MTNQEAITKLTNIMHDDHYAWHPSILTAFGMAVDALEGKGDCISRAEAIKALCKAGCNSEYCSISCDDVKAIEGLPSAQPSFPQRHENDHTAEVSKMDSISRQSVIDTEGLDEQIRCEMCRNPMHTDRGCDGNCKYDEILYEKIIQLLNKRITQLPSAQPTHDNTSNALKSLDCIDRQAAIDAECEVCQIAPKKERGHNCTYYVHGCKEIECLRALPSAQPEIIRCKDCKYYRQHNDQDDLCVYTMTSVEADDYCSYAERKEGEAE